MYKLFVGTQNRVKLDAVRLALKDMGLVYEVVGLSTDSGVSSQPFSDKETIEGATNRALKCGDQGLRMGLEAGVEYTNGHLFLVNWGVLIDHNQEHYMAGGTRIPLPKKVQIELEQKQDELATIMDRLYKTEDIKHHEGAIGLFTDGSVKRIDIFVHIVKLLMGQYLVKNGGK
ncbi:MAG: DUF84 family protein [Bacilli bacterium]|nr:DUF84 family protein [Bacilli bacterium]